MQIKQETHGAVTVIGPDGALAQDDAEDFKACMVEAISQSAGRVVVDMTAVPFIDSRGLEVLVETNDTLVEGGRSLKICGINETIREVLDLTDLAVRFDHYDDTNSALRSFH